MPDAGADASAIPASTGARSTTSSTAAPTRPARTTATSRAWRCCSRACRRRCRAPRSTACADRASTRSAIAARAIKSGETSLMIAGGVESMTRAPFVHGQGRLPRSRARRRSRTRRIGWRFVNPLMKAKYGIDSMPETAENVAAEFGIARADQDAFALRSQQRAAAAIAAGRLAEEIVPVTMPAKKGDPVVVRAGRASARDRRSRRSRSSRASCGPDGTVTAGNASGVNDGACAMLIASADAAAKRTASRRARASSPRRSRASRRASWASVPRRRRARCSRRPGSTIGDMDVIELNEAFAAQALAVHARPRAARRRRARESERRRDRARPSARRERRAPRHDRAVPAAAHRRPLRARARCASASARASPSSSNASEAHELHRSNAHDSRPRTAPRRGGLPQARPRHAARSTCYPPYASTVKRSPSHPLVLLPTSLSEVDRTAVRLRAHQGQRLRPHEAARGRADRRAHRRHRAACSTPTRGRSRTRWSRSGRPTPPAATRTSATSTTRRPIPTSRAPAAR